MACMEHTCGCGFCEMNNKAREPAYCPRCGKKLMHAWDEQYDDHEDREEEE